jgi:hypothetical protein
MKVIMWDVDDVLNDLMGEWFRSSWQKTHPECPMEYSLITSNPPHELLGVPKEEYLESLDAFRQNNFKDLKPLPEMLDWFSLHGHKARHIVVTSVPLKSAHCSAEWVFTHFGRWIRSFNIVPSPRPGDAPETGSTTKAEYISAFDRIDIVVEDSPETLRSMEDLGIQTVTVPRPWNQSFGVTTDALAQLDSLIVA